MKKFEKYNHHGVKVAVRSDLRGQHREYCLCHFCEEFTPEDQAANCLKANLLYAFCVLEGMTTPVWECPDFSEAVQE